MGVFVHASSLRRLVCTMIKTAQSFSVHFHSLNLNFNISITHGKGNGYPSQELVKSLLKTHKIVLYLIKNDFTVIKVIFNLN